MTRTLLIAIGNPLRGDDGVAAHVCPQPLDREGVHQMQVLQLTPELAEAIALYDTVVFLDADVSASQVSIDRITEADAGQGSAPLTYATSAAPLTHVTSAVTIVTFARQLFGFTGQALLCRLPVASFAPGGDLSATALHSVTRARELLASALHAAARNHPPAPASANFL